ncbi:hypothetical protein D9M69_339720 [compost metagenome]
MHQAADAATAVEQLGGAVADQRAAALADEGEVHRCLGVRPLESEHQARDVGGDTFQPRLAFLQRGPRAAPFGDVAEVDHQVLGLAETQEAQRHVHRQQAAVGAPALALEMQRLTLAAARAAPQVEPAVHVQVGLEVGQRPLDHLSRRVAEHLLGGAVGVAHAAVPVDPENADGALVDGELGQAQCLLGQFVLRDGLAGLAQALFTGAQAATQHRGEQETEQRQHAEQHREVAPEAQRLAEARLGGLQPALLQTLMLVAGPGAQRAVEDAGELRPVAPRGDPQQLRQADVGDRHQAGELRLARQQGELRGVDHRVLRLPLEHPAQALALALHRLQAQVGVVAAQEVRHRAGAAHRHRLAGAELFEVDAAAAALAHQQVRHAQVGVGEQPQAQTGRGLRQAGGDVHLAGPQRRVQFSLIGIAVPLQLDPQRLRQPLHDLDVDPGILAQAAVVLRIGRLQQHADPPLAVSVEPGALLVVQLRLERLRQRGQDHQPATAQQTPAPHLTHARHPGPNLPLPYSRPPA